MSDKHLPWLVAGVLSYEHAKYHFILKNNPVSIWKAVHVDCMSKLVLYFLFQLLGQEQLVNTSKACKQESSPAGTSQKLVFSASGVLISACIIDLTFINVSNPS